MKRRKALSLLLSLAIVLSLVVPVTSAFAADGDTNDGETETGELNISKTASYNESTKDYTITLEAFATGESSITTQDIPTDFILVLDQSGSMTQSIGTVSFSQYTGSDARNANLYDNRHNGGSGNLWYQLEDGKYVSVSVTKKEYPTCTEITNGRNNQSREYDYGNWEWIYYTNLYENSNNLYAKLNGEYVKVTVTEDGYGYYSTYTYTLPDGTVIASGGYSYDTPTITGTDDSKLYLATAINADKATYTYTYTDASGNAQTIGTSTGTNNNSYDDSSSIILYRRNVNTSGGGSRLNAIKNAATNFVDTVATRAAGADENIATTDDNINHRIAVVGFASQSGYGNNTELLSISGNNSGSVGVAYDSISDQNLKDVVQNMNTTDGQNMVKAAINALAAQGATRIDLGMDMAERILVNNPVGENENRKRVVVVFTDGAPTSFDGFDYDVATAADQYATAIKKMGVTVYSVGVFPGADASSAGTDPDGNLKDGSSQITAACNWFMQKISTNDGKPQNPSYYLSASDAGTLNSIFSQISQQIPTGGSSTELSGTATVKDIVSQYFKLPDNADEKSITLETYKYNGPDAAQEWTKNADAMGAVATVDGKNVSVTGFDFAKNWCGTTTNLDGSKTYRGNKLVIRFNVAPEPGFLGGNDVPTNASAGIYKEGATEPSQTFTVPTVNVPVKDVTVTAPDKNVYLLGKVTLDQLKSGATVTVGNVELKLGEENYGLDSWQNQYVTITVAVKDKAGNIVTDKIESLTDDTTYKIIVTVSPKQGTVASGIGPTVTAKSGSADGKINVFKPELTFVDSVGYYGDTAPAYPNSLTDIKWKHEGTTANEEAMGKAPELGISYASDSNNFLGDKINTKQDIPVKVDVTLKNENVNNYTKFVHGDCNVAGCTWEDTADTAKGDPAFLIHVKTCTLTIVKEGGETGKPYVFDVYKDGNKYTEVTVKGNDRVTIVELPVGIYSITEDTGWSWRYKDPTYANNDVELSALNPTGTITCTNTKGNDQWLNDYGVISNIYGKPNTPATDGNN